MSTDDNVTCTLCGRVWKREQTNSWVYYKGDLYCVTHPGVKQWYEGALKIEGEKMKREGILYAEPA